MVQKKPKGWAECDKIDVESSTTARDLSIRTYHRASAPSRPFRVCIIISHRTTSTQISLTSQHPSHASSAFTLILSLKKHDTKKHDADNIVLLARNAALLCIYATAIITTLRALCKCKPTSLQLHNVVTPQREICDAATRLQGQSGDADARRHHKAKEGHVLQARAEQSRRQEMGITGRTGTRN